MVGLLLKVSHMSQHNIKFRRIKSGKGSSHLECKDTDHRFMITDTVLHVAGVQILSDLQRILFIFLYLLDPPYISIHPLFLLFVLRGVFGSQPPQNPVSPGRFPFLRADTVIKGDVKGAREQKCISQQNISKSVCLCTLTANDTLPVSFAYHQL